VILGNLIGSYSIPIPHSTILAYYGKYLMPTNFGRYVMIIGLSALAIGISRIVRSEAKGSFGEQPKGDMA
jgi:hypothetical protein